MNDGCLVRLDVIATREGCLDGTEEIILGTRLGRATADVRIYLKDPENVFRNSRLSRAFDADAELPADAVDTGYRQGDAELWIVRRDPRFIYLVAPGGVERWPLERPLIGCA